VQRSRPFRSTDDSPMPHAEPALPPQSPVSYGKWVPFGRRAQDRPNTWAKISAARKIRGQVFRPAVGQGLAGPSPPSLDLSWPGRRAHGGFSPNSRRHRYRTGLPTPSVRRDADANSSRNDPKR
jgi:hypothetical protein